MKENIKLRSYPKAIFLWPIILYTAIAWLIQMLVSPYIAILTASELNNMLALVWLMTLFLSLLILSFEFRSLTTFIIIIVITIGLLLGIFLLLPVLGININELEIIEFELYLPTEFYMTLTIMFLFIYLMIIIVNQFSYYKVERNEIYYKKSLFSGIVRFPTKNLRIKKEVTDVFEFFILRSGRITLLIGNVEIGVLNNVLNVNKKVFEIDRLLSSIHVEEVEVDKVDLFSPLKPDKEYALEQIKSKYKEYKKPLLGHGKYKDEVKVPSKDLIPKLREEIKNQSHMHVEELGDKLLGIAKTNTPSESQYLLEVDFKTDKAIFKGYGDNRTYTKDLVDYTIAKLEKYDGQIKEFRESFEEHKKKEEEFRKEYKLSYKKADIKMSLNIFLEKPEQLKEYFKEVIESDWQDEEKDLWAEVMQELLKEWEEFEPEKWEKIADFLLDIAESIPIAGGIGKVVTKGVRVLINWIKSRR
jgi:hypothetical protein